MGDDRSGASGIDDASIVQLLIDSVSDYAIFVLDPRGHVRTWNRGAERLKGYTADEIVGQHFSAFYTDDARRSGLPDALLVRAEREGSVQHSGWRVRKDGTRFWGSVAITALLHEGRLVGFAKVTRDLTEMHEHEEALGRALARERAASAELEQLNRGRTRFLAAIVHDLSTPITVIRSSLQLLLEDLDPDTDADQMSLAVHARRNAEDLEELRAQLQEFARLEGGSSSLDLVPMDLAKIAGEVADDLTRILDVVDVAVEIEPHRYVLADELALRRILTNLVSNAARYAPAGSTVRIVDAPAVDAGQLAVGVVDEGPGISPADQERIFREFWSGRSGMRHGAGLGLGLSIVQGYVRQHGGRVWVDSDVDRGATFWFTLTRADVGSATRPI